MFKCWNSQPDNAAALKGEGTNTSHHSLSFPLTMSVKWFVKPWHIITFGNISKYYFCFYYEVSLD